MDRGYSFAEENDKKGLIESVKTNILESGMSRRVNQSNENVQVTVDKSKQKIQIDGRGQPCISIKAENLPRTLSKQSTLNTE